MYVAMRLRINDAACWHSALRTTVATIIRKTHTRKCDSSGGEKFRESSTKRSEDTYSNFWAGEVQLLGPGRSQLTCKQTTSQHCKVRFDLESSLTAFCSGIVLPAKSSDFWLLRATKRSGANISCFPFVRKL